MDEEKKVEDTTVDVSEDKTSENELDILKQQNLEYKQDIEKLINEVSTLRGKKEHLEHKYERDVLNKKEEENKQEDNRFVNQNKMEDFDVKSYIEEQLFVSRHTDVDSNIINFIKKIKNNNESFEQVFSSAPVQALYKEKLEKLEDKKATPNSTSGSSQPSGSGESDMAAKFRDKLALKGLKLN